jgi:phosphoribosylanthranilate isomerase
MITRVKICGVTRPEDAALAAELGADAIGLNFVGGPRKITGEQAVEIVCATPTLVTAVALLFLDARANEDFVQALQRLGAQPGGVVFPVRQLYGLTPEFFADRGQQFAPGHRFNKRGFWIPLSVSDQASIAAIKSRLDALYLQPGAILLDTASEKLGGSGRVFNWQWIAEAREAGELDGLPPIILAGGLTPDNVADAIRIAKPYAVDVSSGVEVTGRPGVKDPIKLRDFIQAAKSAVP